MTGAAHPFRLRADLATFGAGSPGRVGWHGGARPSQSLALVPWVTAHAGKPLVPPAIAS
jgi:hypothetical protein